MKDQIVKELQPLSEYPEDFLRKLDLFLVNSNLSSSDRTKLVEIIKTLPISVKS
jgi:hypothetical protein